MIRPIKRAGLPLGLAIGALVAVVGSLLAISAALASPATISAGSATIEPGGSASINLSVTPTGDEKVGTVKLTLTYDSSLLEVTGPFPDEQGVIPVTKGTGVCNAQTAGTITCAMASTSAVSGAFVTIDFKSKGGEGSSSLALSDLQCSDTTGGAVACTGSNGTITIQVATPEPTPEPTAAPTATPAPTAAPTATPGALPPTGGAPSDGSGLSAWLLAIAGLAIVSGGVWAVARSRR